MRSTVVSGTFGGLLFGLILAVIAFADAGGGHGTYLVLGLFSSPLGLTRNILWAMVATPIIWGLLGALAGSAGHPAAKAAFVIGMFIHYGAAVVIVTQDGAFGDWDTGQKYPQALIFAAAVYIIGQLAIWTLYTVTWLTQAQPASFLESQIGPNPTV